MRRRSGLEAGVDASPSARVIRADDLEPEDASLIARLVPPTPSPYHRLNPLTKAVIATVGSIGAFAARRLRRADRHRRVMLVLAWRAGVLGRLARASLLLTLPIAISVILVSVFTRAGTTVLFVIGPFDATVEGVDFAAQTLVRLFAISLSIGLFVLTTDPRAFVFDLERRGVLAAGRRSSPWRRSRRSRRSSSAPRSSGRASGRAASTPRAASGRACAGSCRSSGR